MSTNITFFSWLQQIALDLWHFSLCLQPLSHGLSQMMSLCAMILPYPVVSRLVSDTGEPQPCNRLFQGFSLVTSQGWFTGWVQTLKLSMFTGSAFVTWKQLQHNARWLRQLLFRDITTKFGICWFGLKQLIIIQDNFSRKGNPSSSSLKSVSNLFNLSKFACGRDYRKHLSQWKILTMCCSHNWLFDGFI